VKEKNSLPTQGWQKGYPKKVAAEQAPEDLIRYQINSALLKSNNPF
jgi:hypothetical protein